MAQISVKCVVVGDGDVGKTCMIITNLTNSFPKDFIPTVYDTSSASEDIEGVAVQKQIWDTAGEEDYDRLRPLSYPATDIFLICFSIVAPSSFNNVSSKWMPEIKHFAQGVPFILVGTKIDLREDQETLKLLSESNMAPISQEQGQIMATQIGAEKYMECSALTQRGLNQVFDEALKIPAMRHIQHQNKKSGICNLI